MVLGGDRPRRGCCCPLGSPALGRGSGDRWLGPEVGSNAWKVFFFCLGGGGKGSELLPAELPPWLGRGDGDGRDAPTLRIWAQAAFPFCTSSFGTLWLFIHFFFGKEKLLWGTERAQACRRSPGEAEMAQSRGPCL